LDILDTGPAKKAILKAGYEYTAKVPRINMNSSDQRQDWLSK
jgi:hypothetical protein